MRQTLHLAPGHSAAGSFRQTFQEAGLNDEILTFPDDLSCGPIKMLDAAPRTAWWGQIDDESSLELTTQISGFWNRLASSDEHLIAWVGKRSAREHAFLLAVAHELGNRPFSVIDVAEQRDPPLRHPKTGVELPGIVSVQPPTLLRTLIGNERPVTPAEHAMMRGRWKALQQEDAPFRITTGTDLVSAPEDHFDAVLIAKAATEPQKAARIVGNALSHDHTFAQVGDLMLLARLVALIETGKLIADGNPWDIRTCLVRLAS